MNDPAKLNRRVTELERDIATLKARDNKQAKPKSYALTDESLAGMERVCAALSSMRR